MFIYNHKIEAILLIFISLLTGILISQYQSRTLWSAGASQTISAESKELLVVSEPSGTYKESSISEISSDGKKTAILKIFDSGQGIRDFALYIADESSTNDKLVYSKRLFGSSGIALPFNMWSPDNRYFFINEYTPEGKFVKVFNADGSVFADGEKYLDLTADFNDQEYGLKLQEATGWGGYNLIVFNTVGDNDAQGSSFWYEIPSRAIIRLSTLFL